MNCLLRISLPLLGGCLALPAAAALSSRATPVQGPSTRASIGAQDSQPQACLVDVLSGPLPGKADYCQAMQDWNDGHYQDGLQLLKLAAGWGNKNAQYTLGLIHYGGHHVATNVALGLAWFKLADERNNDARINMVRRSAFKSATPAERRQAQALYGQLRGQYGDKVAAARAWHHLQRWRRRHGPFASGCVRVYGAEAAAARRAGIAGMPPAAIRHTSIPYTLDDGNHGVSGAGGYRGTFHHQKIIKRRMSRKSARISQIRAQQRRQHVGSGEAGTCITLQTQRHVTQQLASSYFAGTVWGGTVTVAPLQQVPAPASSSGH